MYPHTDLVDIALFFLAAAILAIGAIVPRRVRPIFGAFGFWLLGALLADLSEILPFPTAFAPFSDGSMAEVDGIRLAMKGLAAVLAVLPLLVEAGVVWPLACAVSGPVLGVVLFTTASVAGMNPMTVNTAVSGFALSQAHDQVNALAAILTVGFAAVAGRWGAPRVPGFVLAILTVGCASAWRSDSFLVPTIVVVAFFLVASIPAVRDIAQHMRWRVLGSPSLPCWTIAGLMGLLLLGLAAVGMSRLVQAVPSLSTVFDPFLMKNGSSATGWVRIPGTSSGVLPLAGVYLAHPMVLASLATSGPSTFGPRLRRILPGPAWIWMGLGVTIATQLALLLQKETGLTVLVGCAFVAWWVTSSANVRATTVGLLVLLLMGLGLYTLIFFEPTWLAAASGILDRFGWFVFSVDDARTWQIAEAMSMMRVGGPLGMGFLEPGGPSFAVPVWSSDFLVPVAVHVAGVAGGLGVLIAAVMPAVAMLVVAREGGFERDCDESRAFALFAAPWSIAWGGAGLWITAGSLHIVPLSGVTLGLVASSSNVLVFSLVALGWMFSRASAPRALQVAAGERDLRWSLGAVGVVLMMGMAVLTRTVWNRLTDSAEAHVLPADIGVGSTVRVEGAGPSITVEDAFGDQETVADGETFTVDPLQLRNQAGTLAVVGVHVDAASLGRGFHAGAAGRAAAPHPTQGDLALGNDLWLESNAPTRWREFTLRRANGQMIVEAPATGSAIRVLGVDGGECTAEVAGATCVLSENTRLQVRSAYEFIAHVDGNDLVLDWMKGVPALWLLAEDHDLLLGGRADLAAREVRDQVYDQAGRQAIALLGQFGALRVEGGKLRVGPRPTVPGSSTAGSH